MQQDLLPLFPLQMVLLPGAPAALHIFEERYKEMIGDAVAKGREFGIVLASEKGIVNTGCTAVVDQVTHKYDDGRMDIIAVGRRRFEILFLNEEKTYLQGAVEYFDDEEEDTPPDELRQRVQSGFEDLQNMEDKSDSGGDAKLSFRVAGLVEDINLRQMMLGLRSETARLKQLDEYLPAYLERLREASRVRELARRNGHGRRPIGG